MSKRQPSKRRTKHASTRHTSHGPHATQSIHLSRGLLYLGADLALETLRVEALDSVYRALARQQALPKRVHARAHA